jgi:hypothetical protein
MSMHLILTGDMPLICLFVCNCNATGCGNLYRKQISQSKAQVLPTQCHKYDGASISL